MTDAVLRGATSGADPAAVALLARTQHMKHRVLMRHVVATASAVGHPRAAELAASYDLLAAIERACPEAVAAVLRHPPVGIWAVQAVKRASRGLTVDHGYLAGLVASAAILGRFECETVVPVRQERVFLPYLGEATFPGGAAGAVAEVRCRRDRTLIVSAAGATVVPARPRNQAAGWSPLKMVVMPGGADRTGLLLEDHDPYRLPGADVAGPLDGPQGLRWRRALRRAWHLLGAHHPGVRAELAVIVTAVVPLAPGGRRHASATHRDGFGAIGLSPATDVASTAALLAHERQHAKLNAVLDQVALVDDPGTRLWYAPWRPDSRPLGALLHGAYAHLGVAEFWRRQRLVERGERARRAATEFARWREAVAGVVVTLGDSGALTPCGLRLVEDMRRTVESWRTDAVPATIARRARGEAGRHRLAWERRYGRSNAAPG